MTELFNGGETYITGDDNSVFAIGSTVIMRIRFLPTLIIPRSTFVAASNTLWK